MKRICFHDYFVGSEETEEGTAGIFSGKESLGDKKERKIIKDEKRRGS